LGFTAYMGRYQSEEVRRRCDQNNHEKTRTWQRLSIYSGENVARTTSLIITDTDKHTETPRTCKLKPNEDDGKCRLTRT